ncbi:MAG: hypothetical protein WC043_08825 [Pseudobdellovibrionaceae bacterium]
MPQKIQHTAPPKVMAPLRQKRVFWLGLTAVVLALVLWMYFSSHAYLEEVRSSEYAQETALFSSIIEKTCLKNARSPENVGLDGSQLLPSSHFLTAVPVPADAQGWLQGLPGNLVLPNSYVLRISKPGGGSGFSAQTVAAIDRKIDDGLADSGIIRGAVRTPCLTRGSRDAWIYRDSGYMCPYFYVVPSCVETSRSGDE